MRILPENDEPSALFFTPADTFRTGTRIITAGHGRLVVQRASTCALKLVGDTRSCDLAAAVASSCLATQVYGATVLGSINVWIGLTSCSVSSRNLVWLSRTSIEPTVVLKVPGDRVTLPVVAARWSGEVTGMAVFAAIDAE